MTLHPTFSTIFLSTVVIFFNQNVKVGHYGGTWFKKFEKPI